MVRVFPIAPVASGAMSEPGFEGRGQCGDLTGGAAEGDASGEIQGKHSICSGSGRLALGYQGGEAEQSHGEPPNSNMRGGTLLLLGSGVSKCDSWAIVSRSRGGRCP